MARGTIVVVDTESFIEQAKKPNHGGQADDSYPAHHENQVELNHERD